ncbi:MAG TPA: glycosyltransferase [Phycisphaerales bacterium]|nr:glycosyltransferase [Phycisphaerales bacterium]
MTPSGAPQTVRPAAAGTSADAPGGPGANGSGVAHGAAAGRFAWPRSPRPLRVALLGWARLSSQALEGSGYNLSASELARGLALSGHEVFYLQSGMSFRLYGGPRIRPRERWGGVECFELINSPNLATSFFNFRNVEREIACPRQARLVVRWLEEIGARVVHVHSLEGYGLDLVGAIADTGRPVVVTPHNYHALCPQVDLLYAERQVCEDYDGGRRCETCLPHVPSPRRARLKRATGQTLETLLGVEPADAVRKVVYGLPAALRGLGRRGRRRGSHPPLNPDRLADPELAAGFIVPGGDGLIRHDLPLTAEERPRDFDPAPADQNERVLARREVHLRVLGRYGRRRAAGAAALNRATLVTSPSDFLRRVHVEMGVEERRTRWVRLGQPHFDQINRRARRSPFYGARPWDPATATRPLRFAYYGTVRPNKGLEVLARAIPLIDPALRRRCQFIIHAAGNEWAFRKRLSLYPEVSVYGAYDLYQLIAGAGEYDVGLLPHIWMENSPLVMLEHLHAGKFVIASRLGGPPDWIRPPANGLLFPAGDAADLARCLEGCASGAVVIPSAREVHEASVLQSYPAHVREVEGIYHEVLAMAAVGGR